MSGRLGSSPVRRRNYPDDPSTPRRPPNAPIEWIPPPQTTPAGTNAFRGRKLRAKQVRAPSQTNNQQQCPATACDDSHACVESLRSRVSPAGVVQPPTVQEQNRRTQPSDRRTTPGGYSLRPSTAAAATREIPHITSAPLPASSWGPWGGNLRLYSPQQQRLRRVASARSAPSTPRSAPPTPPPPVPSLALSKLHIAPPEPPSVVEIHTVHSIPTTPTAASPTTPLTPTTPFTNAAPLAERSDSASPRPPSARAPSARVRTPPPVTPRSPRPSPRAPLPLGRAFAEAAAAAAASSGADEVRAACSHRDACDDVVTILGTAEECTCCIHLHQMRMSR